MQLPLKIDPFRFADQTLSLEGNLSVNKMKRLLPSLSSSEGEVKIHIQFGVDEQGTHFAKGSLATSLVLRCQRCMEPFNYEIMSDFLFGFATTEEQARQLPHSCDAVIVENGELWLNEIIEEELLVSLPIVPLHDPSVCKVTLPYASSTPATDVKEESPFKVVELLRSKNRKQS